MMKVKELTTRLINDFDPEDEVEIETSHDVDEETQIGRRWPILDVFCESDQFSSKRATIIRTDY